MRVVNSGMVGWDQMRGRKCQAREERRQHGEVGRPWEHLSTDSRAATGKLRGLGHMPKAL